jgi:hypothetical protein
VVLKDDVVYERGNHETLLAKNGAYATFWHLQVGVGVNNGSGGTSFTSLRRNFFPLRGRDFSPAILSSFRVLNLQLRIEHLAWRREGSACLTARWTKERMR